MTPTATKRRPRHTPTGIELPRVDGRTVAARRFRDLVVAFTAELGADLTEPDKALIKQAAALTVQSETIQTAIAAGEAVNMDQALLLAAECRQALISLQTRKVKRDTESRRFAEPASGSGDQGAPEIGRALP
jgi:hypothetical protein